MRKPLTRLEFTDAELAGLGVEAVPYTTITEDW